LPTRSWSERYGEKHRFQRVTGFPAGVQAPRRVRIYCRGGGLLLQWWDPGRKQNTAERIDGDLISAIVRARQIEESLAQRHTAGAGRSRLPHAELVERYLTDLHKRADAGAIRLSSVRRLRAALHHYLAFCEQPAVRKEFPFATNINRDFQLAFAAYLSGQHVSPNGHAHTPRRLMKGAGFVTDAVRAMLEWAADPDRGALLPDTFRNPFLRSKGSRPIFKGDPLAEPDINLSMALDFVRACDPFQLRLFVPLILYGLRPSELCFLFREYLDGDWLQVPCHAELNYFTKGGRSKRLPLLEELAQFWKSLRRDDGRGLLYERRTIIAGREKAILCGATLAELTAEFQRRCAASKSLNAAERLRLRDQVFREAGGMNYDHVEQEFRSVAGRLGWPAQATLKDFRHLFATMLGNTPMAEAYKKYLLGQSVGRTALMAYTHLNELRLQYGASVRRAWTPLVEAILQRLHETDPA
jgi:hypothetical protein